MSEVLIEHPVLVVEELLKLGIGDEGRLLYLRNAITKGTIIHDSDKKFLKRMYMELDKIESESLDKQYDKFQSDYTGNKKNTQSPEFDSGITKIQNLIGELKKSNSKLMDNLELLLISREITSQSTIDKSNSFGSFLNLSNGNNADLFDLIKNDPISEKRLLGIKKHDVMTYASAGLFALWFAGYQNVIDIDPLPTIALGLSAGAAVSAGIFYKLQKASQKEP